VDALAQAFFLETGGALEWAPDPKDGYGTAMHMEPRYHASAGFAFEVSRAVTLELGYQWRDMPPLPGRDHDTLDKSQSLFLTVRVRPFRRD